MIYKAKIVLVPILPKYCTGKQLLFRTSGMYRVLDDLPTRKRIVLVGGTSTNDMSSFNGFYQPIAVIPELSGEDRRQLIVESDWAKASQYIPKDILGVYQIETSRDEYVDVYLTEQDGYVSIL